MIPALAPVSSSVRGHRGVGASTGFMRDHYGDWPRLVREAAAISTAAAELSALSEHELAPLVEFLGEGRALPFRYLSVHAPSKGRELPEADVVDLLCELPLSVDAIVVHPDGMEDPAAYSPLGTRLVLENMDRRKGGGRTALELSPYFDALPEAGLCFDVAHAASVDPGLEVAHELLDRHGHRLRHVHLSSLDDGCHHRTLTPADELRFGPLLDRCRDVPWILEAPPA